MEEGEYNQQKYLFLYKTKEDKIKKSRLKNIYGKYKIIVYLYAP